MGVHHRCCKLDMENDDWERILWGQWAVWVFTCSFFLAKIFAYTFFYCWSIDALFSCVGWFVGIWFYLAIAEPCHPWLCSHCTVLLSPSCCYGSNSCPPPRDSCSHFDVCPAQHGLCSRGSCCLPDGRPGRGIHDGGCTCRGRNLLKQPCMHRQLSPARRQAAIHHPPPLQHQPSSHPSLVFDLPKFQVNIAVLVWVDP